jgi:hypothetical protein
VTFDKREPYRACDIVVVHRRTDAASDEPFRTEAKRLVMGPHFWVRSFPFQDHPESDAAAAGVWGSP